jgi:hypothetical protein
MTFFFHPPAARCTGHGKTPPGTELANAARFSFRGKDESRWRPKMRFRIIKAEHQVVRAENLPAGRSARVGTSDPGLLCPRYRNLVHAPSVVAHWFLGGMVVERNARLQPGVSQTRQTTPGRGTGRQVHLRGALRLLLRNGTTAGDERRRHLVDGSTVGAK